MTIPEQRLLTPIAIRAAVRFINWLIGTGTPTRFYHACRARGETKTGWSDWKLVG